MPSAALETITRTWGLPATSAGRASSKQSSSSRHSRSRPMMQDVGGGGVGVEVVGDDMARGVREGAAAAVVVLNKESRI